MKVIEWEDVRDLVEIEDGSCYARWRRTESDGRKVLLFRTTVLIEGVVVLVDCSDLCLDCFRKVGKTLGNLKNVLRFVPNGLFL